MNTFKRVLCLVSVLFALVSLCACTQPDPDVPQGFLLAENEGADYFFYYPESWLLDRCDAGMTSAYVSEVDFSNVSVTAFTASSEYASLPEYAEHYYLKQFTDNFRNLEVERNQDETLKRSVLKIDGCDAIAFNYKATFGGEAYSFRTWLISYNGYVYTVLYTARADRYEANFSAAEEIAENIRFK